MHKRSFNLILAVLFLIAALLPGGNAQGYLSPDYNTFGPGDFVIGPGVLPDYLTTPNWAFSPPLRKFIDPLPGLCNPAADPGHCNGGKKIPIAIPDIVTYPGSDYYVIELRQYKEKMHTDLANPTTLRGYVQGNNGTDTSGGCKDPSINPADPLNCTTSNNTIIPGGIHFLGPVIIAKKNRPVRVLFKNLISPGVDGDLFLPVDDTIMGAGVYDINYNPVTKENTGSIISGMFSTNRATLHLHGGKTPWISDGTPHQWITPAGEDPNYPQGMSVQNVPDMPIPAPDTGEQTFYWTNQQSSRFMFYHDHAWGITRLNVYAGEAAGYLIRDDVEQNLIDTGIIPGTNSSGTTVMGGEIPLVIEDKTFVDANTIDITDPTWNWGTGAADAAHTGVITFVTVTDGGSGYDTLNPPAVNITDGTGSGATANAVINSVVTSIDVTNGGSGYISPIVMIDDPTGSGATAEATVSGGVITAITVTSGGWGYSPTPTVTIDDLNNTPSSVATATATVSAVISAVAVTNGGSGYTDPVVTIDPPLAGVQATASATVTDIKPAVTGDLWWPHVYMPAQNPYDVSGVAPMGRWAYGPYFYPATNNLYQPIPNPYYSPLCNPADDTTPGSWGGFCQAPEIPSTPDPSWGAEAFMDTQTVNGTAYPYVDLAPKAYRLRILNASHDRFLNLSMYIADSTVNPNTDPLSSALCSGMGGCAFNTEIPWIDASAPLPAGYPATWPVDGRPGGVPKYEMRGPDWIMIGNEGGFLPMPVKIESHPLTWNINPSMFNVGNVNGGSLIIAPAERADVVVDFSDPKYHGKTLILYNDGAAPWPAINPQYDFFTGNPDGTSYGSAPSTLPGFGPNTRTVMQIRICDPATDAGCAAGSTFDLAKLQDAFDPTTDAQGISGPGVFQQAQDPIIAAQGDMNTAGDPLLYEAFLGTQDYSAYSKAYGTLGLPATFPTTYPNWGVSRINDKTIKFMTLNPDGSLNPTVQSIAMKNKSIHDEMGATFDDYGRMRAGLGLEKSSGGPLQVNFIVQTYSSPSTEVLTPGETQIWKITHNGVDTHPIHFHLYDVQVLNRVGWDGFIRLPDPTELGWKETVRISPLEDTIVALRPKAPTLPFGVPRSYRPLNPAAPLGSTTEITQIDPVTGNARVTTNEWADYGWEYVWHCHILSHEENDMMRAQIFNVVETAPAAPTGLVAWPNGALAWTDNATNEYMYRIDRSSNIGSPWIQVGKALANATSFIDPSAVIGNTYWYRVAAVSAGGEATSGSVSVTISAPTLPGAPVIGTATGGDAQATVNFTAPASDGGSPVTQYTVTSNPGAITATGASSPITVTGLTNGTAYTFTVTATNSVGTGLASAASNSITPVTSPAAPSALVATPSALSTNAPTISLTWTDNANNEAGFSIERATDAGFTVGLTTFTAGVNVTAFTDTTVALATGYYYRVRASNIAGFSAYSNDATALTPGQRSVAPSGLVAKASALSANPPTIALSWTDNSGNETGFNIQRATDSGFTTGLTTFLVGANATAFTDTTVALTTKYWYRVQARNPYGNSGFSNKASATTAGQLPARPTGLAAAASALSANPPTISLSWTDNSTNESSFIIERATDPAFAIGLITFSAGANAISFVDNTVGLKTKYYYRVRAANTYGVSAYSGTVNKLTAGQLPADPTNLAVVNTTRNSISLSWTDNAANEVSYRVQRSTSAAGPWSAIATLAPDTTAYTNSGLGSNKTFYYRVRAANVDGYSAWTNVVSGTTLP